MTNVETSSGWPSDILETETENVTPPEQDPTPEQVVNKVATCKICKHPLCDQITKDILEGVINKNVITKYNAIIDEHNQNNADDQWPLLNKNNITSHRGHMTPQALAVVDANRKIKARTAPESQPTGLVPYGQEIVALQRLEGQKVIDELDALNELIRTGIRDVRYLEERIKDAKDIDDDAMIYSLMAFKTNVAVTVTNALEKRKKLTIAENQGDNQQRQMFRVLERVIGIIGELVIDPRLKTEISQRIAKAATEDDDVVDAEFTKTEEPNAVP